MLWRLLVLLLLFINALPTFSWSQKQYVFRITFKDKNNSLYTLDNPSAYLSTRALERRNKQHLTIDSSDLPINSTYIDSVLSFCNGIYHCKSKWANQFLMLLNDSSKIPLLSSISFIKSTKCVAQFLSPLHSKTTASADSNIVKNKALNAQFRISGTKGYYGDAYDQIKLAQGDYLHDKGYSGKNMLIAVLDAGFNKVDILPGFENFRTKNLLKDQFNFNLNNSAIYGYADHGTQVLSTMAGVLNTTYVGTAPEANYALYITENNDGEQPIEMDQLLAAIERADSIGADVISISLGYNTFDIAGKDHSLSLSDIDGKSTLAAFAANTATQKGMLVVASAGNEGLSSWKKILTPGDADSALTCGSVDINKNIAASSGIGPNAANITKPDLCMLGAPGMVLNNAGTTSSANGTSIATPELAGLSTCLWQAFPQAKPYMLKDALRQSAHNAASPNNSIGWGVPNFQKAFQILAEQFDTVNSNTALVLYPNPFEHSLKLNLPIALRQKNLTWQLIDIQGRMLDSGTIYSMLAYTEIFFKAPLESGLYQLKIIGDDFKNTYKVLKLNP